MLMILSLKFNISTYLTLESSDSQTFLRVAVLSFIHAIHLVSF